MTRGGGKSMKNQTKQKKNKSRSRDAIVLPRPISAPVTMGVVVKKSDPVVTSVGSDSVIVSNTEWFSDVGTSASAGTYVDSVVGLIPTHLTWLGGVALNYSKYRFLSLEVFYIPSCGTTTSGSVGTAIIYDPRDGPITTMRRLSNISRSVICPPWAGYEGAACFQGRKVTNCVKVEPDPRIYRDDLPVIGSTVFGGLSDADKLLYCRAWMVTATAGSTSTSLIVGSLYARYRVQLRDPISSLVNN